MRHFPDLAQSLATHVAGTKAQIDRLGKVLESLDDSSLAPKHSAVFGSKAWAEALLIRSLGLRGVRHRYESDAAEQVAQDRNRRD